MDEHLKETINDRTCQWFEVMVVLLVMVWRAVFVSQKPPHIGGHPFPAAEAGKDV